jgi:hypothetical protein
MAVILLERVMGGGKVGRHLGLTVGQNERCGIVLGAKLHQHQGGASLVNFALRGEFITRDGDLLVP